MEGSVSFAEEYVASYREIHEQLRAAVRHLSPEALGWTPGPDTNSIWTIVVHLLGSEEETLRVVRGLPSDRNRAAEFASEVEDSDALVRRIDGADRFLEDEGRRISQQDLAAARVRPNAVRNREPRPGLFWLLNSYGHAREHLAHLELTKQLLGPRP